MSEVKIKKLSIDKINFFDIDGVLELKSRKLKFQFPVEFLVYLDGMKKESNIETNIMENFLKNVFNINNLLKTVYIIDENDIKYSCINCKYSYKVSSVIKVCSISIDYIIENAFMQLENIKINQLLFKMYYLKSSIHYFDIEKYSFDYTKTKKIFIEPYVDNKYKNLNINLKIETKINIKYRELSKILYTILELFSLLLGETPTIKQILLNDDIILYLDIVVKYKPYEVKGLDKFVIGNVTINTINKDIINKFLKFRKETKIIYDLFLINLNSDEYFETKNCKLIQIMEGLYKTLNKIPEHKKIFLYKILLFYFNYSKATKKILSRRDKRKIRINKNDYVQIFLYKAKNHRNYLSHLNLTQTKNVFIKSENLYAFWKLSLCIRLFILEFLGINYNMDNVEKYVKKVNDWAIINKVRFSSKK